MGLTDYEALIPAHLCSTGHWGAPEAAASSQSWATAARYFIPYCVQILLACQYISFQYKEILSNPFPSD